MERIHDSGSDHQGITETDVGDRWPGPVPLDIPCDVGTQLATVDFAKIAEGFGCYGENLASIEALPAAFQRALTAGKPDGLRGG